MNEWKRLIVDKTIKKRDKNIPSFYLLVAYFLFYFSYCFAFLMYIYNIFSNFILFFILLTSYIKQNNIVNRDKIINLVSLICVKKISERK